MRGIVVIIVRDEADQFFVHQRREDKETNPSRYGLGAGGRIEDGESPLVAAIRELREETGLGIAPRALFELPYEDELSAHMLHVFEVRLPEQSIQNDDGEWQWSGWLSKVEVDELCESNMLCPDTTLLYARYLAL